jgi:cbb3-type cytochrome oxidase maturation protein
LNILVLLIPLSFCMGAVALAAFFWSMRSGQYDDLAGDAERILHDAEDAPLRPRQTSVPTSKESTK